MGDIVMSDAEYKVFFEEIQKFKERQEKQKKDGKNDFNILTTLRKYDDEVYLHSAMIGALLDPQGKHYQNTLFLKLFLESIKLDNWDLDLDNTQVLIEYKDIDLYITDGNKHIIIENKIWGKDQPCQIIKYINIIIEENKEMIRIQKDNYIDKNSLQVIYLSPREKNIPDEHKILIKEDGDKYITFANNTKLVECSKKTFTSKYVPDGLQNYSAKYRKISYNDEVINWLELSKKEIVNNEYLVNLYQSINQYIDVILMLNNKYEGKVVNLKEYIKEDNGLNFKLLSEITQEYTIMIKNTKKDFLERLEKVIKTKIEVNVIKAKNGYLRLALHNDIYLQTGIKDGDSKIFITLYKEEWIDIDSDEKNKLFEKIQNIEVNNERFEKTNDTNVYAMVNIVSSTSKEFLEVEDNINLVLNTIKNIKEKLNNYAPI